jgi:uncharacterized protein (DUF1786 family)
MGGDDILKTKILAIDIGAGTQDILLFDSSKKLENCIKLVLPSPSQTMSSRLLQMAENNREVFIAGHTVGGGALAHALKDLAASHRIIMTPAAAYTVRNNLEDVIASGIEIREEAARSPGIPLISLDELNLAPLELLFNSLNESVEEVSAGAVAVQDHGSYESGRSNRKTRLSFMKKVLEGDPRPLALSYLDGDAPPLFPRMTSAASRMREQLPGRPVVVMDTSPAAVAGCLSDKKVAEHAKGNLLLINAGNGHTLACILQDRRIVALLEHHTRQLQPDSFAAYLEAFCDGKARDEDGFMASGHGLFYLKRPPGMHGLDMIGITGPNREILEGTGIDFYYPTPGGDMMMTGPMGLVEAAMHRIGTGRQEE